MVSKEANHPSGLAAVVEIPQSNGGLDVRVRILDGEARFTPEAPFDAPTRRILARAIIGMSNTSIDTDLELREQTARETLMKLGEHPDLAGIGRAGIFRTCLEMKPPAIRITKPISYGRVKFTPAQMPIADGISRGKTNKQIASSGGLSPETVRSQLRRMPARAGGLRGREQLGAAWLLRAGQPCRKQSAPKSRKARKISSPPIRYLRLPEAEPPKDWAPPPDTFMDWPVQRPSAYRSQALDAIREQGGEITGPELAHRLALRRSTANTILRALERDGEVATEIAGDKGLVRRLLPGASENVESGLPLRSPRRVEVHTCLDCIAQRALLAGTDAQFPVKEVVACGTANRGTIHNTIKELHALGFLQEMTPDHYSPGIPSRQFSFNDEACDWLQRLSQMPHCGAPGIVETLKATGMAISVGASNQLRPGKRMAALSGAEQCATFHFLGVEKNVYGRSLSNGSLARLLGVRNVQYVWPYLKLVVLPKLYSKSNSC